MKESQIESTVKKLDMQANLFEIKKGELLEKHK